MRRSFLPAGCIDLDSSKSRSGFVDFMSARWHTAGARSGRTAVWKPHDSNENNPDYKSCFPVVFFCPLWNGSREEIKCVSLFRCSGDLIFSASTLPAFIRLLSADCQSDGESLRRPWQRCAPSHLDVNPVLPPLWGAEMHSFWLAGIKLACFF